MNRLLFVKDKKKLLSYQNGAPVFGELQTCLQIRFDFIVFTNKTVNYNMDSTFRDRVVTNYLRKRVNSWQFMDGLVAMT